MIKLSELQRLDKVSLAEIEKIIEEYDDIRMLITRQINEGKTFEELLMEASKSAKEFGDSFKKDGKYESFFNFSSASKIFYVLEQMKTERTGVNNV